MGRSKLKVMHVAIIGVVVALVALGVAYFAFIKPTNEQIAQKQSELEGLQQQAAKLPSSQQALQRANLDRAKSQAALARYEARYMRVGPNRQIIDFAGQEGRTRAMLVLWREQAETLGPILERYMNRAGVRLLTPIAVPPAPTDPMAINPAEIRLDFPGIQVTGTYRNILRFLNSLREIPRLILVNNVTLSGSSPLITAAIDLSVFILPRNADKAQPVASVAGGDTSGMGGGAFGPSGPSPYGPYGPAGPVPGGPGGAPPSNGAAAPPSNGGS